MVENRNNRLLNAKLNKYIVPGIMMSLALQLGNIVDTIFVSNLIGVEAMSAVTMSLPVETIVQLTGYCLGVGGSIAAGNAIRENSSPTTSVTMKVAENNFEAPSLSRLPSIFPAAMEPPTPRQ